LSLFRLIALRNCCWKEMEPNEQSSLWTYIKACAQYRWLHSEEIFMALSADLLNINTGFARQFNFQTAYDTPQSKLIVNYHKSLVYELIVELVHTVTSFSDGSLYLFWDKNALKDDRVVYIK